MTTDPMARLERLEMLMSACELTITGRIGRDPEVRYFQSGTCKLELNLAVNKPGQKRQEGERSEADWFRVELWGDDAQAAADALKKGDLVRVRGRFHADSWTTRDGEERVTNTIKADMWAAVPTKQQAAPAQHAPARAAAPAPAANVWQSRQPATAAAGFDDSSVPF